MTSSRMRDAAKPRTHGTFEDIFKHSFIIAALVADGDIIFFALWFLSSFFLFFIPRLLSAVAGWMSTIFLHMA